MDVCFCGIRTMPESASQGKKDIAMIFGLSRLTALAAVIAIGFGLTVQAGEKHHIIPETVDAIDLNTGGPYYAPPVPGGHYTKDTLGHIAGKVAGLKGLAGHAISNLCSNCGGTGQCAGCGAANNTGGMGTCGSCGGTGIFSGHGSHSGQPVIMNNGNVGGNGHGLFSGLHGNKGAGNNGAGHATFNGLHGNGGSGLAKASPQGSPSAQSPSAQSPCANGGCGGSRCGDPACNGLLKGLFGGKGAGNGSGCGTPGCTSPGCGNGLFAGHGGKNGYGCGTPGCTDPGCGNGAGYPGMGNGAGHPGLGSKLAGLLGMGHPKVKWFVGPGGPVPLTPGYVPYVNPVRSPRDYFAFPPYLDQAMQPGYGSMPQSTAGFATDKATAPADFIAPRTAPVPPPAPRSVAPAVPAPKPAARVAAPAAPAPAQEKENN